MPLVACGPRFAAAVVQQPDLRTLPTCLQRWLAPEVMQGDRASPAAGRLSAAAAAAAARLASAAAFAAVARAHTSTAARACLLADVFAFGVVMWEMLTW